MTISEFAVKYSIPYHVVYKASCRVKPVATMQRSEREYEEGELKNETARYIKRRLRETKDLYYQYADSLKKLRNDVDD